MRHAVSEILRGVVLAVPAIALVAGAAAAGSLCEAERPLPMVPVDEALCAQLAPVVAKPAALPLAEYETKLGQFLRNFCHRDTAVGWVRDKRVRDTGPFTAALQMDGWHGAYHGTHAPVVIWYSPQMADWVRENRGPDDEGFGEDAAPVPEGALLVKEMFPAPASRCEDVDPLRLLPTGGATVMVRDSKAAHDGWFWGWFGWSGWAPDYPANTAGDPIPLMGFGPYCTNCHASARDHLTFAAAKNLEGEPGEPLVFLSTAVGTEEAPEPSRHREVVLPTDDPVRLGQPLRAISAAIVDALPHPSGAPTWDTVAKMPSQTYDNVWMPAGMPTDHAQYLTSDQCLGCHDAGSTGLQFDMTQPDPVSGKLLNLSPYGTWRTSPMGLAGRDPIFFAQLASETQSFHPDEAALVENTCLGCHGILGQRQFGIDQHAATGSCGDFRRELVAATPWPPDGPLAKDANYGALARDGISCTACHHMVLGEEASRVNAGEPRNVCVEQRQALLNPDVTGFARTFTGSFLVGPPDNLYGPFKDPKTGPMKSALGITPKHDATMLSPEVCGTCHTVHLPVLHEGKTLAHIYEQTTYPEWAFSAYRTGEITDGPLPEGKGAKAETCQGCHMPSADAQGHPYRSKIASIQEYRGFPQAEFTKAPDEIDLPVREGFARHTLVGLNVFLVKMAQQFTDVFGMGPQDPMLLDLGVDSLVFTEQAMLNQARDATADVSVSDVKVADGTLSATVRVDNKVGHKFPSGVGFRRAFLTFEVLDQNGTVLWASGRTDGAGRLVDATGTPIDGEVWWKADCSARIEPLARKHQPHYQVISAQNQAQIYQELVSTPPPGGTPAMCSEKASPAGELTTSFLSICAEVKDNRLLPDGFLDLEKRKAIAVALGAGEDLAVDVGTTAVGDDPDYVTGGGDSLVYRVNLAEVQGTPVAVRARLYYQAIPPFYLQDRFCSAKGDDPDRLYFLAGHLNLESTQAAGWKLKVKSSGKVPVPH
jgi:hypothetical protein